MRELIAVGAGALAVRVGYVLAQTRFGIFDVSFVADDSALYLALARSIASGHGMTIEGAPTAYVGPVYPLFLGPLVALGADPTGIGLVQAVVGAATAILAGLLAVELSRAVGAPRLWERRAGIGAAVVAAAYPHLVFWTGYVLTETLF